MALTSLEFGVLFFLPLQILLHLFVLRPRQEAVEDAVRDGDVLGKKNVRIDQTGREGERQRGGESERERRESERDREERVGGRESERRVGVRETEERVGGRESEREERE